MSDRIVLTPAQQTEARIRALFGRPTPRATVHVAERRLSAGWPDASGPFWEVGITFHDVRDLEFVVRGPGDVQCPGFDIEDIRDRQWDGVNLLVHDYEAPPVGAPIHFGARRAEVRTCRVASQPPNSLGIWQEFPGAYPHHLDDAQ